MAVTTILAFFALARDGVPKMVGLEINLRLMTQLGGVLVPLPTAVCETIKNIEDSVELRKSDYDAALCFVVFTRVEEVIWSDDSCVGRFPFFWDTPEVSNTASFKQVTNKRTV